jgi:glutathione synthase/RimK-type ligase-like ATP-grasp enzyme
MILLWGLEEDAPMAQARTELRRRGAPVFFLDHRQVLDCHASVEFVPMLRGRLETPAGSIELEDVRACYLRPYNFRQFPDLAEYGDGSSEWQHAMLFEDIVWSWAEVANGHVLNRASAMASNNSKPYQAQLIAHSGFRVPDTLVTTTPESVRSFCEQAGDVIYKSVSGVRSIVHRLGPERMNTLDDVVWCPTQFQAYVPGTDYRVHVVGERVFACAIESSADDYRYSPSRMRPCTLPDTVAHRCVQLSHMLRLPLCGIDLRQTPDEEWFCFEVNPSPAWSCFSGSQDIGAAIASLLLSD